MSKEKQKPLRVGSFCSGIAAPETAWRELGWTPVFFSEIDPFASAVLAHHYPDVPNLGDMEAITDETLDRYPVDVVVAGTPCQDFSVAGKRAGFAGARGSLTFAFIERLRKDRPEWFVFENVPGILSGDCESGFYSFLDELEALGYVLDVDILDAQFFGVPQRRRRVFICGQHVDALLKSRTTSSALTICQCLTECSLLALAELSGLSLADSEGLNFDASTPSHSLRRRMRLFGLDTAERASMWLESLDAVLPSSAPAQDDSASRRGKTSTADSKNTGGTKSNGSKKAAEFPSIGQSWSDTWAASLRTLNECITSTPASGTTESRIYICALLTLNIAERITHSPSSCPTYWSAEWSALTALEAFTNYARAATSNLFAAVEWVQPWLDFLAQAERAYKSLGHSGDGSRPGEILSFLQGLPWHIAPSREAGARIAASLTRGADSGGKGGYAGRRQEDDVNLVQAVYGGGQLQRKP